MGLSSGKELYDECFKIRRSVGERVRLGVGYRPCDMAIKQDRAEIEKFLDVLLGMPVERRKTALEVGLWYGGTHVLWRRLFDKVITIELEMSLSLTFAGRPECGEGSVIVCSDSGSPYTKRMIDSELGGKKLDLLFIDGNHTLAGVERDYFNYEPLVGVGGVVGFHDTNGRGYPDVKCFLEQLEKGGYSEAPAVKLEHIHLAKCGISYYVKS